MFKAGDSVVALRRCNGMFTIGKVYKVKQIIGDGVVIEGLYEDGEVPTAGVYADSFRLAGASDLLAQTPTPHDGPHNREDNDLPVYELGRTFYPTGYSALGYNSARYASLMQSLAKELPRLMAVHDAQAVAVRGTSGYAVAFAVRALNPHVPFLICRKSGERSHSGQLSMLWEDPLKIERYLIVDDLVDSGETVRGMIDDIGRDSKCSAIVEYRGYDPAAGTVHMRQKKARHAGRIKVENWYGYEYS